MKYRATIELDGTTANEVASRLLASFYANDIDIDALDVDLVPPSKDDIDFLTEGLPEPDHDTEVFHFPRTRELLNYLNGEIGLD